jgi:hypothetical protein
MLPTTVTNGIDELNALLRLRREQEDVMAKLDALVAQAQAVVNRKRRRSQEAAASPECNLQTPRRKRFKHEPPSVVVPVPFSDDTVSTAAAATRLTTLVAQADDDGGPVLVDDAFYAFVRAHVVELAAADVTSRMADVATGKFFECRGSGCPDRSPSAARMAVCVMAGCRNVAHVSCAAASGFTATAKDDGAFVCGDHSDWVRRNEGIVARCKGLYGGLRRLLVTGALDDDDRVQRARTLLAKQAQAIATADAVEALLASTPTVVDPLPVGADVFAYVQRYYDSLVVRYPLVGAVARAMVDGIDGKYRHCRADDDRCRGAQTADVLTPCVVAGCRNGAHAACLAVCGFVYVDAIDEYICARHGRRLRNDVAFLRQCADAYRALDGDGGSPATRQWLARLARRVAAFDTDVTPAVLEPREHGQLLAMADSALLAELDALGVAPRRPYAILCDAEYDKAVTIMVVLEARKAVRGDYVDRAQRLFHVQDEQRRRRACHCPPCADQWERSGYSFRHCRRRPLLVPCRTATCCQVLCQEALRVSPCCVDCRSR